MKPLKVGLGAFGLAPQGGQAPVRGLAHFAERAEALGFHSLWVAESHFDSGSQPAPLLALAAMAARTRRIALGTTSYLLSVRHPVRVAEDVAVLDQLSGGRVIFGIGRGFRASLFEAFDAPAREKRDRFESALRAVLDAWRGKPLVSGPGGDLRVTPIPVQQPHPPIWVAAFGPKALAQAGRLGFPYLASPLEPLEALVENYALHRSALPAGCDPCELAVPVIRSVYIDDDAACVEHVRSALAEQGRALAAAREPLRRWTSPDAAWALLGTAAQVRDQIETYRGRIGLSHLIARVVTPGLGLAAQERALEALASLAATLQQV